MSILQNLSSLLRYGVHLSLAGVMTAALFVALPWSMHGAKGNFSPVYEFAPSGAERPFQVVMAVDTLAEVMDGEGDDAVVDAPEAGDGTTEKVDGVAEPELIGVNRPNQAGRVMRKKQLGITHIRSGREISRVIQKPAPKKKRKGKKCLDPVDEIQELGPGEWRVEKEFVVLYTEDSDRFNSLGRVVRSHDDKGHAEGWQLRRIRCGSPLHQGGFRNGDVVLEVDGRNVASIRQVFKVYRKSKRRDVINVTVRRKGQLKSLTYYIG